MSFMKKIGKALTPSFLDTTGKILDGTLTQLARATDEWVAASDANAGLRAQVNQQNHEERKLEITLAKKEFAIEKDRLTQEAELATARYALERMTIQFNIMVRQGALAIVANPDKAALIKAKLSAHKATMDEANALVLSLANIVDADETDVDTTFTAGISFDDL